VVVIVEGEVDVGVDVVDVVDKVVGQMVLTNMLPCILLYSQHHKVCFSFVIYTWCSTGYMGSSL